MPDIESKKNYLLGIVFATFQDAGPTVIYNDTKLRELQTLGLAVEGMTIVGLEEGSVIANNNKFIDELDDKLCFGPIPVPEEKKVKALAISFDVQAKESTDSRIQEHGRKCILFILFKESYTREILDAYGLVKPYFSTIVRDITSEKDLTKGNLLRLSRQMELIFSEKLPRVFTITKEGAPKELIGKKVPASDVFLIADRNKETLTILFYHPDLDVWRKRQIYKAASELNSNLFRNKLTVVSVTEISEITTILTRMNIKLEPIDQPPS